MSADVIVNQDTLIDHIILCCLNGPELIYPFFKNLRVKGIGSFCYLQHCDKHHCYILNYFLRIHIHRSMPSKISPSTLCTLLRISIGAGKLHRGVWPDLYSFLKRARLSQHPDQCRKLSFN